ncbi:MULTISPECIES: hypothetical protein [unclassified Mesorhizobium]|uniref:hypothetical protein n=1 Tax=unclassified Mesorhizobium TaxID=325217 RepID=UPI000FD52B41|nr:MULTISPECIES: hypothetical protein [unclassified Mesorhizobium]RUV13037.1 hypothetical protein EOA86_33530 [Mesorhizobium sp. M5C.F.Ca.IN.020.32.2.1]
MPPFFIPAAEGQEQTEQVYAAVVAFNHLVDPQRYYSISYTHNGRREVATVGEPHVINGEPVLLILKERRNGAPFLICTENRGVVRGGPILASGDWQTNAIDFTRD